MGANGIPRNGKPDLTDTSWKQIVNSDIIDKKARWMAFQTAAGYGIAGILWICTSDSLIHAVSSSQNMLYLMSIYKGFLFVIVTGVILFFFQNWQLKSALKVDQQFRLFMESNSDSIAFYRGDSFFWINEAFARLHEGTGEQIYVRKWIDLVAPEDRQKISSIISDGTREDMAYKSFQYKGLSCTGRVLILEASMTSINFEGEEMTKLLLRDVSDRELALDRLKNKSRILNTLFHINSLIPYAEDKLVLMKKICKILVENGNYAVAWYGEDDGKGSIIEVASYGDSTGFLNGIKVTWDDSPTGSGPTGTAFRTKEIQFVVDVYGDSTISAWRDAAIVAGYRSAASMPILADGNIRGVLTVYSRISDFFNFDEVSLLTDLSGCLGYTFRKFKI